VQIGEKQLAGAQQNPFARLWFLDLYDHVAASEDFRGCRGDFGTRCAIGIIACHDARSCARLHHNLMAMGDIFTNRAGG
jgi:hypothetical protein